MQKDAPLSKKLVQGNHTPFMNELLRKVIYTKSELRNEFCKTGNEALYKSKETNAYL